MQLRLMILATAVVCLTGCSFVDVPDAKSTTGRPPSVAEIPEPDETVRGANDPPIVTLKLGSRLHERRLTRTESLPGGIIVPTTNLNAVPVAAALQAVLAGTDVSLSWDTEAFGDRLVTVTNLSGPLPQVVDKICASAKVFCGYRDGLLEMKEKETFIVELPAVPSLKGSKAASNSMAEMIGTLSGEKVKIDQDGGNLVYTTDVVGQENVRQYLKELRHGRPLVVMQLYIWEVSLNKENAAGINWSSFSLPDIGKGAVEIALAGSTGFSSLTSPGVSLGATLSGNVNADSVLQFLYTQGQVQTISNPQLTFVSGATAEFRVGGKQRYISEVGELTSSVSSSTSNSNTVSTDELETGLTVSIGGSYESGVISAMMQIEMEDVVSLNPTTMDNGSIIDLPETTERMVNTSMRVRPGDNLVLAGLVSSRDANDKEGIPLPFGLSASTYHRDQLDNSEIVILVKPSIVLFVDSEEAEAPSHTASRPQAKAKEVSVEELPDAVLIDKDGSKTLALPMASLEPTPSLLSATPLATGSGDGAPVGKNLLQRGFSYAYDSMLAPSSQGGVP